jgi:3'(2'), 5'-bisphosphate nucleotidase
MTLCGVHSLFTRYPALTHFYPRHNQDKQGYPMLPKDIQPLIPQLIDLVKHAGAETMLWYKKDDIGLKTKSDNSPITAADLAANEVLNQGLKSLTPNIDIISEENTNLSWEKRQHIDVFWMIDPIDGTKEFINQTDEFTINLALIINHETEYGFIYAPALGEFFHGGKRFGATKISQHNETKIHVKQPCHTLKALVSRHHKIDADWQSALTHKYDSIEEVDRGSSLKFCQIAQGDAHIYPKLGSICEWDTAAAQAILEGAGGSVIDWQGKPLRYNKENLRTGKFVGVCDVDLIK